MKSTASSPNLALKRTSSSFLQNTLQAMKRSFLNESSLFIDPVAQELIPNRASIVAKEKEHTFLTHNEMVTFLKKLNMVDSSTKNELTLKAQSLQVHVLW